MLKNHILKKRFSVFIIMAVVIMLFTGCSDNQHKYTITYEAQTNSISEEQMNDAKNIIKDRFKAIDFKNVTVTQKGDKSLKAEVSGDELANAQADLIGKRNEITMLGPDKSVIITGEDIIDSISQQDPKTKENLILIKFTQEGKNKFAIATSKYIGHPITIYLDDEIISEPIVQTVITDGQAVITGNKVEKEAKELAAIIKEKKPLPFLFKVTDIIKE